MVLDRKKVDKMLRYRWVIFVILIIGYFFVYFHRVAPSVVAQSIVADVGGSIALLASVYFYTYLLMQLPSGLMTDKIGPRAISFAFLMLAAFGTFLTAMSDSFMGVVIGKVMIACGMACIYIPLTKVIAVWFRKKEFASLNGVVIAVGNVGAIAASAPLAMLADTMGWREVFFILGIITLILALLCLLIIRDHPKKIGCPSVEEIESEESGEPITEYTDVKVPMKQSLKMTLTGGKRFWMPAAAYFLVYGTIMVYQGLWAGIYFNNAYDFAIGAAWLITAVGVGKIISAALAGTVARKIFGSKRKLMIFGNVAYLAVWGIIWLLAGDINEFWFWFGINFLFGFFSGFMTISFAMVKEGFPIAISGTVIAVMNILIFSGAAVLQTLSGFMVINTTLSEFTALWAVMFICTVGACILSFLSLEDEDVRKKAKETYDI